MNQRTWVEISESAFNHNVTQLKQLVGSCQLALPVKANAYGHGLQQIAYLAEKNDYITLLCTANSDEALFLRKSGIKKPILNLVYYSQDDMRECIQNDIVLTIVDAQTAYQVIKCAESLKQKVRVHIKIDTGLHRLGALAAEIESLLAVLNHDSLIVEGIFTHISDKDNVDQSYTRQQLDLFADSVQKFIKHGTQSLLIHALSSGALEFASDYHYSMVRPGTNMYGLWSSSVSQQRVNACYNGFTLHPVMTWKTRIMQIKDLDAQAYVGYARTYQTTRPTKIAILPIGYWDGYPRILSNRSQVMIKNSLAPIIGIISMNLAIVDVTDISHVEVDDEVILLSGTAGITASDIATLAGTINIEITTRINSMIPRIMVP